MKNTFQIILVTLTLSLFVGFLSGILGGYLVYKYQTSDGITSIINKDIEVVREQSAIIDVAKSASESVVSVVVYRESNNNNTSDTENSFEDSIFDSQIDSNIRRIASGSGFIVSKDGLIVTNRHVVDHKEVDYKVLLNNGSEFDATLLAKDTLLDIAFLEVEAKDLPFLDLGTSAEIQIGQSVVAIGNALGEFSNSVSSGIISGLGRNIIASGGFGTISERISNVIQTDASINPGNSGGPLLDLEGNVIGVNVAVASDAENIGFAIPVDSVKDLLKRLDEKGEIDRPLLGVRYIMLDSELAKSYDLSTEEGAYIPETSSINETVIVKDSPADKAGVLQGDVIVRIDDIKVTKDQPLFDIIQNKYKGDRIELHIIRDKKELSLKTVL